MMLQTARMIAATAVTMTNSSLRDKVMTKNLSIHFSNSAAGQLSTTERRVVQLLADEGLGNEELGHRLGLSKQTVRNYIHRTSKKLGVKSRVALAILWNTELFQIGLQP
jgi:DNA-binding NarL/FixJ family response regulator